jgi:hypothetical protein
MKGQDFGPLTRILLSLDEQAITKQLGLLLRKVKLHPGWIWFNAHVLISLFFR